MLAKCVSKNCPDADACWRRYGGKPEHYVDENEKFLVPVFIDRMEEKKGFYWYVNNENGYGKCHSFVVKCD